MIGRQVIETKSGFTLDGLLRFMEENWDTETCGSFVKGKPTKASVEEYILLPATERFMVIVFPRKAGGLFNKANKVVLSVCDTPDGLTQKFLTSVPTHSAFVGAAEIGAIKSSEDERKGPAEEALQFYTKYMRHLLKEAGEI